jgi:molybdopterin-guanine dinucleotide biosynthesis protein A
LTGVLLVGGTSGRFGSPKALARLGGETLAERAWRVLGDACEERIAVGKRALGLPLPFELLDDGTDVSAPIAGVVAGLRAAAYGVAVFLPVDVPLFDAAAVRALGEACDEAGLPESGPLPGAYAKSALPVLERRLARGRLSLRGAVAELDAAVVELDHELLVNVNTPEELAAVEPRARQD